MTEVVDEGVPYLLAALWAMPEPMPFAELLAIVVELCEAQSWNSARRSCRSPPS